MPRQARPKKWANPMQRSFVLTLYMLFARFANGWARRTLQKRLARGKEDPDRLPERLGQYTKPRPDGPLIWIHAASVGESQSVLELARRILSARPELHCMITTGTVTSARALEGQLPDRMFHQFIPLDTIDAVEGFLTHWQPDLAIWTESELWPALLLHTRKHDIPMLLVNARMSEKSYKRWRMFSGTASSLLNLFDKALVQNTETAKFLQNLGMKSDRIVVAGSLKEGASPLPHNEIERKALAHMIAGRMVWLAASTHEGEEAACMAAHRHACRSFPELLLILAPRHPERGDEIAAMLRADGLVVAQRSKGQDIENRTDVYLADTIGEMGLWFRLAPVSFMGGSLSETGGHNPFEPATLGSAILYGPHVFNFTDAYADLASAKAAIAVTDAEDLAAKLETTLSPERAAALATAAWEASSKGAEVTDRVLDAVLTYFPERAA